MKNHLSISRMLLGLFTFSLGTCLAAEITKEQVIAINDSFIQSMQNKDFSVYEKYLYEGTQIYVDLDPAKGNELQHIDLQEFTSLAKMSMEIADEIKIDDELIAVEINPQKNQATLVSRSTVYLSVMGTELIEISEGTTVFGLINGEIKILSVRDEMISSEMISARKSSKH